MQRCSCAFIPCFCRLCNSLQQSRGDSQQISKPCPTYWEMAMAEAESRTRHRIEEILNDIALSRHLRTTGLLEKTCSFALQDNKRNSTCFLHQTVVAPAARPLAQIKLPIKRVFIQLCTPTVNHFLQDTHREQTHLVLDVSAIPCFRNFDTIGKSVRLNKRAFYYCIPALF